MSGHNGYGNLYLTREQHMADHDAASRLIRWLCNYSVAKWSAYHLELAVRKAMRETGCDRARALKDVMAYVQRQEVRHTLEAYGPDHPEARAPMARRA